MTKRTTALALLAVMSLSGPLLAHGGYTHVIGTVTAMDATHVEVKTKAGKTVSVKLSETTKFTKDGAAAAAKDMLVGQRVSVEAKGHADALEASEVKLGVVSAPEAAK